MKKVILLSIICASLILLTGQTGISSYMQEDPPNAPDFTVIDLEGNEITLTDYQGKIVFLNFWATWCSPCREEIPGFIEAYEEHKEEGMRIIGISLDQGKEDKIREFVEEYKINYPVAKGDSDLVRKYQTGRVVPETFIIDQEGKFRHKHIGFMDKETLEKYFNFLKQEKQEKQ